VSGCEYKRIKKIKVCAGDLRHRVTIQTRALQANIPGQVSPSENFTELTKAWAGIETPNGYSKFAGVNINKNTTHIFIVRYQSAIANLEVANNFVLFDGRRMRILDVKNMNEDNLFLAIQCTERGDDSKTASDA